MMEHEDFDALLDRTLAGYAEPASGMEEQVLAELRADARRSEVRSRRIWGAGSIAAVLALGAALLPSALHRHALRASGSQRALPAQVAQLPAAPQSAAAGAPRLPRMEPARGHARHSMRMAAVARGTRDPGNRVPLPLIVPEDAQERALRIAITRPGFLAALDAAQAPPKPWKPDDLSDGNPDESQMNQERK